MQTGIGLLRNLLECGVQVLESGNSLSRKNIVLFVVQRLSNDFPQASKTSVGHVVQLLYRASCFNVSGGWWGGVMCGLAMCPYP